MPFHKGRRDYDYDHPNIAKQYQLYGARLRTVRHARITDAPALHPPLLDRTTVHNSYSVSSIGMAGRDSGSGRSAGSMGVAVATMLFTLVAIAVSAVGGATTANDDVPALIVTAQLSSAQEPDPSGSGSIAVSATGTTWGVRGVYRSGKSGDLDPKVEDNAGPSEVRERGCAPCQRAADECAPQGTARAYRLGLAIVGEVPRYVLEGYVACVRSCRGDRPSYRYSATDENPSEQSADRKLMRSVASGSCPQVPKQL
ncbi:hypothetical protein FA95DRAFT_1578526 [Auriscalpium vulgare]|uniref:Uncharacterized protein n=1 Tax=Auriscalpium vulgare TaxID=40419 RepID=A0ACB8R2C2_9AGAM|nr:hypothetical protein FA95DRAFT_1578526 [Auriscalpium vulgare]